MKHPRARFLAPLIALLSAAAGPARADYMNWVYHWSVSTPVITSGTGSVNLAVKAGNGAATIPAVTVTTTSAANQTHPDVFHANYTLALTVSDPSANASGSMTFAGLISGTLTATNSALTNTFLNTPSNPLTQQITVGKRVYNVTIDPTVTRLPAPGSSTSPLLDAKVQVGPAVTGAGDSPEPASLVLAGMGFSLFGLGCWWKRPRQAKRPIA